MSTRRSVLVVVDALADNGSLRWAHRLTAEWLRSGWGVDYLALTGERREEAPRPPAGASVTFGNPAGRRFRQALPALFGRGLRAARAADVVLVVSEVGVSVPFGYLVARLARRPFVVYVQSIPAHAQQVNLTPRRRPFWRFCLTHADAVLCVSPAGARSAVDLGVRPARITLAPTGIDVDDVRRRGLLDGAEPVRPAGSLVACGELYPHKGYDLLVRAVARVHATGRGVRLTLIGQGRERAALEQLAADLGVADVITFRGQVPDPLPEIAAATAFVHTARVESVGLVLLEAMALGVPTIAVDCAAGGPRMVLDGGRFGDLVQPESVPALAEAICAHLDAPTRLVRMAAQGDAGVRERFSPARSAAVALDVLARVVGSAPPARRASH